MNVLAINDYLHMGGAEVLMHTTADGLRSRGHAVELFTDQSVHGHRRTPVSYVHNRLARRALQRTIASFHPDVIHLHNFYHELSPAILGPIAAWKLARRKQNLPSRVIMTAHDFHLVCPSPGLTEFRSGRRIRLDAQSIPLQATDLLRRNWDEQSRLRSLLRVVQRVWNYTVCSRQRVIDLVICPSAFLASVLRRAGFPVTVLSNPTPAVSSISSHPRARGQGVELGLVFAGRLEPEKGLSVFLQAVPMAQPWTLDVIGDGRDAEACTAVLKARPGLSDRVRMLGKLPREATLDAMSRAHALLLPSIWHENQPTVMLEALSRGASLLVADGGGMQEIVHASGVGEVFSHNPHSIGAAISRLSAAAQRGTLNSFDVTEFLGARSLERYLDQLTAYMTQEPTGGGADR